jgi:hypothetical protein
MYCAKVLDESKSKGPLQMYEEDTRWIFDQIAFRAVVAVEKKWFI